MMKELEKLMKEYSGMLSRMKIRDGNEILQKTLDKCELIEYNVDTKKKER